MLELILILVISLLLTEVIEVLFAIAARVKSRRELMLIFLMNVVTNPPVVLITRLCRYAFGTKIYILALAAEIPVVIAEGLMYSKYSKNVKRPFVFAAAINVTSFSLGLGINFLGGLL